MTTSLSGAVTEVANRLGIAVTTASSGELPTISEVARNLCLCTEPHTWGGTCSGPAPGDTPIDSLLAAAVARALRVASDPSSLLDDGDGEPFPDGERTAYLLDPADFDFYLATLARALTRSAAA